MMSFSEFAKFLENAAERTKPVLKETMLEVGVKQVALAKGYIGHELPEWAPLADTTLNGWHGFPGKIELGYTGHVSATDPLLRDGKLRDSIEFVVVDTAKSVILDVGSNDPVALYQEMGTVTIPPRPFISLSAVEVQLQAQIALGKAAASLITPKK